MSTKTTFKRVALVAVAALGFGLLSSVSANAGAGDAATNASIASITVTKPATPVVGSAAAFTVAVTNASTIAAGTADTYKIRAKVLTAPAGGLSAFTGAFVAVTGWTDASSGANLLAATWSTGNRTAATVSIGTLSFTPAVVGEYSIAFYHDGNSDGIMQDNEVYNTSSITVGSAVSGLTELGNAATTTASASANLTGLLVPSVGVTIDEVSGRVAQMVGFAPHYFIKRNAGHAGASADTNTAKANLNYTVTNPAGTAVSVVTAKVAGVASTEQNVQGDAGTIITTASASTTTTTSTKGSVVYFNPATAGTYTITVWHDADGNNLVSTGEATATKTVVIAADALPSITFTKYGSNATAAQSADGQWGQLVKVSLRNGTTPFTLAANESLVLTSAASTTDFLAHTAFAKDVNTWTDVASGVSTLTLTAANFNSNADAWFNIGDTTSAGGTFTVSAVINGGTANGASGSLSITTVDTSAAGYTLVGGSTTDFTNANDGLGVQGATIADADNAKTWNVKLGVATTVSAKVVSGANNYKLYNGLLTDTLGLITGVVNGKYNVNATTLTTGAVATSAVSLSVAIPATTAALASGTTVATLVIDKGTDATLTIAATSSVVSTLSTDPSDLVGDYSLRAAAASTNKFTAYVWDQFGNAVSGAAVTAAVTGRNATAVATTLLSDATGAVSFSVADTYTGTLLSTDTLTFTSNSQSATVTINYTAYNPASTVAITGGASADTGTTVTLSQINAGTAGAAASTALVKMTATVKDANGATLPAGIPVKWAISGLTGTSAILVDATTGYDWSTSMTDSNGQAITYVYAWGTGTVSVTATAGTVTSATAGKINFANATGDARVVSATASATGVITAKVVDRYGNAVKGVSITATRTAGTGYFGGNAASSTTGETNASGTVDFIVVGGEATVTVATTTLNAGQTSSASGFVGTTAVTATGIGASLAPAGVQSVSVTVAGNTATQDAAQAASDAAAEATDAANAATDAANAAAEAADAATAAAQDAADAVAALSTQVAEMVDALKKQITALTNLVIKIQKKVRA
jgi:hypothetical protein